MEKRNIHLFRVTFMLDFFILLLFSTEVMSVLVTRPGITEIMRNDTNLCNTSKFLYESEFTKPCASLAYPIEPWNSTEETLDTYLCLGVYDTAYKICQYSSRLQLSFNSTAMFNSYMQKFVPVNDDNNEANFCQSLKGFTSLYNQTNLLWKPLVKSLNRYEKCLQICFNINGKIRPLCAVLAWVKSIDDNIEKMNKTEQGHDFIAFNAAHTSQIDQDNQDKIDHSETSNSKDPNKEFGKEIPKKTNQDIEPASNDAGQRKPIANLLHENVNAQKVDYDMEKSKKPNNDKDQQENDIGKLGTPVKITKLKESVPTNSNSQTANAADNVPNKETSKDKKQDANDPRSTTISENTQDHYDGNPDEDVESNIGDNVDDIDDTIQQPIGLVNIGNQNENLHELLEQTNSLRRPNIRTEDDSHFFAYFTMITVGCIAGYIGYHNKQKILAIVLEGRRSRNNRGRRRPSTSNYRKLDCTLEEAVTSQCNANVTHVIY